jgi:cytidylate kinase
MNIAICGPGRCGKDTMADRLVEKWGYTYAGTTSTVISREIAQREGITFEEAHAQRHQRREEWFRVGIELRGRDAAALAREVLKTGNLVVGVRDYNEMFAVIEEGLADIVIWVARDVPHDPTMHYGPEMCDIVIENRLSLEAFHSRIDRLAKALGIPR